MELAVIRMRESCKGGVQEMDTPKEKPIAQGPPSRQALRSAYELILTRIWPRLNSNHTTSRRIDDDEDSVDTKWPDYRD